MDKDDIVDIFKSASESMKHDHDWYIRQLYGLLIIIRDNGDEDGFIANSYIEEKIKMIMSGDGINFHPLIKKVLEKKFK